MRLFQGLFLFIYLFSKDKHETHHFVGFPFVHVCIRNRDKHDPPRIRGRMMVEFGATGSDMDLSPIWQMLIKQRETMRDEIPNNNKYLVSSMLSSITKLDF